MVIPTEPIGSIPRPQKLLDAIAADLQRRGLTEYGPGRVSHSFRRRPRAPHAAAHGDPFATAVMPIATLMTLSIMLMFR
jgi:hypothetical protein